MKKSRAVLLLAAVATFALLFFYQPVQEGKIYNKKIKLPEISEAQEESFSDNKMIRQAKNTLENVFSVTINESDYNISVSYESSQISNHTTAYGLQNLTFANINFSDKNSNEVIYAVECDTSNGEILMMTRKYDSPLGDFYKPLDELKETAKSFFEKITLFSTDDILYIDDGIQGNTYRANITVKNTYERYILYLDAFDGTAFYYWKAR